MGARLRRHRARARGRGSAEGGRGRNEGDRDRSEPGRGAPAARAAASRRRPRRRGAGRDRQGARLQSIEPRGARPRSRRWPTSRTTRPPTTAKSRRRSRINPTYGEVYRIAGQHAASHYRFEEAAALAEKALTLDPTNSRAAADLGMHLLRTGDEPAARRALDRSWRARSLRPRHVQPAAHARQPRAVHHGARRRRPAKMHRDEAPVLREYAMPLAQEALKTLSARYGFTPTGPILVEIFPKHDDFAVRNLGLPGMIGALGACFGRVVTMDSPTARAPGTFSWQATLWHELAHVDHAADVEAAHPALADRGHLGLRGKRCSARSGGATWKSTFARAMDRGKVLQAEGSQRRVHASRHDFARLLRSVAARRAHRRHARPAGAARAGALLRRRHRHRRRR